jgi:hypothetical protein
MIKIKTIENSSEKFAQFAEWLGIISMSVATLTGLAELPSLVSNHSSSVRAEFALVSQASNTNNPLLREKDESGPHYVTYGTPRTVNRSGRR